MQRKWQVLSMLLMVAIVMMGAFVTSAQDDDDAAPFVPPCGMTGDFGPGMMMGRGFGGMMDNFSNMMGRGFGNMMGYSEDMWATSADVLGLTTDELFAAMQDGKTIADIAEEQGVELSAIIEAHMVAAAEHMADRVEAGIMTEEQRSEMLTFMAANIEAHLSGDFSSGFGPGMMMDGHPMMDGDWTPPMWNNGDGTTSPGTGMMGRGGHGMGRGN